MDLWSGYWWIAAFALLAFMAIARSRRVRRELREADGAAEGSSAAAVAAAPSSAPSGAGGEELVAVITAAVMAASGLAASQFRISHIQAAGSARDGGGFNTPAWGHADRFTRPEYHR